MGRARSLLLGSLLALAAPLGGWQRVGELAVGEPLSPHEAEALAFNPWATGPAVRPAGPFQRIRRDAYRRSQQARGTAAP